MTTFTSPVVLRPREGPGQPDPTPELDALHRGFEEELLVPLWTAGLLVGRMTGRHRRIEDVDVEDSPGPDDHPPHDNETHGVESRRRPETDKPR